jgi:hypothetical protein
MCDNPYYIPGKEGGKKRPPPTPKVRSIGREKKAGKSIIIFTPTGKNNKRSPEGRGDKNGPQVIFLP